MPATRHRVPTIFTLSMVDVLCCALGCVILLWLLNVREAKQRTLTASKTQVELSQTRANLLAQTQESTQARSEREKTQQALLDASAALVDREAELAALEERLSKKSKEQSDTEKDLLAARQRANALQSLVRDKEGLAKSSAKNAAELVDRLSSAEMRLKKLKGLSDTLPTVRDKLAQAESNQRNLEGANARLLRDIDVLESTKKTLTEIAVRTRLAADNRFAGITLTGKRVVFLVDMSGSMELVDETTPAPDKWQGVRTTLAKVMRSLPDLEKFQIILFSGKTSYLLGNEGHWLDYDAKTSVERALDGLATVKPKGNTNMYDAFESAFQFRSQGLDTIYLLSDGLPNTGAGLPAETTRKLSEGERGDVLGKHVRKTLKTAWNREKSGQPRVRINAIGFFYESPDVGAFLWALSRENEGSFVGMSKP